MTAAWAAHTTAATRRAGCDALLACGALVGGSIRSLVTATSLRERAAYVLTGAVV
ncbi:MAG: hypothetical protein IPL45_10035 [Actinomycetales bacterium]|nr:hypothetical protein [Actinomycetales bacterium]